jgi:hypothetical protein
MARELRRALGLASYDDVGEAGPPPPAQDGRRPGAGRSRVRVLVTALTAAALVVGGVSAAIALSGGGTPQAGPSQAHGGPTDSVSTHDSTSPGAPTQDAPTQGASAGPAATSQGPAGVPLSLIKVCTFPASVCTSSNPQQMRTEPAQIVTTGDGSEFLKDLTWSGWGQPTAQGTGLLEVDNCTPNCAQGTYTGYHATVTLTRLTPYGHGNEAYADMTVTAPGSPYQPDHFTSGLVP